MSYLKVLLFTALAILSLDILAQCSDFAREEALPIVNSDGYISDGHLNALSILEGEELNLNRPLYQGVSYRVVFVADENIPLMAILVRDAEDRKIMHKAYRGKVVIWDITPSENMDLNIGLMVPYSGTEEMKQGCVAVLVGLRN